MKTKCLLYCTMRKPELWSHDMRNFVLGETELTSYLFNGTIVAECEVECEEILLKKISGNSYTNTLSNNTLLTQSCLTQKEIFDYLSGNWHKKYNYWFGGYALHISKLKVFDKPLKLKDLLKYTQSCYGDNHIKTAPQNMMWVWYKGERYCLISIRPQWLCKILNGEKPIEVRKKVLKGMI